MIFNPNVSGGGGSNVVFAKLSNSDVSFSNTANSWTVTITAPENIAKLCGLSWRAFVAGYSKSIAYPADESGTYADGNVGDNTFCVFTVSVEGNVITLNTQVEFWPAAPSRTSGISISYIPA